MKRTGKTLSQKLAYIRRNIRAVEEIDKLQRDTFTCRDIDIPLEQGSADTVLQFLESIDCLEAVDKEEPVSYRTGSLDREELQRMINRHLSASPGESAEV